MAGRHRGRIDLAGFHLLDGKKPGDAVTFAARLKALRLDNDDVWRITLEPDSGVFLNTEQSWKAFETLGGPPHSALAPDAAARWERLAEILVVLVPPPPGAEVIPLADLTHHVDEQVIVEGRAPHFEPTKEGGWNEFTFAGVPVRFRLPVRMGFRSPPKFAVLRFRGILSRGPEGLVCDVSTYEPLLSDPERLRKEVAGLPPRDIAGREDWVRWAEQREAEYHKDSELLQEAHRVVGEVIRLEAEQTANKAPRRQLELAQRARTRQVPEPEPSALAHGAFRPLLKDVSSAAEAETLAGQISAFFPAAQPVDSPPDLASWEARYKGDPTGVYRQAPAPIRAALDRRLVADALEQSLTKKAAEHPNEALALADQAAARISDRPEVAKGLKRQGLDATDVGALRLAEVQERARLYEQQGAPDQARNLLRRWLDDQRAHRLSPTDAEGRLLLAGQYEDLLGDQATAAALLQEAWKIDPEAPALTDAFRRRGFSLRNGQWMAPAQAEPPPAAVAAAPPPGPAVPPIRSKA